MFVSCLLLENLLLSSLIPLLSDLLFPVLVLLDLFHTVLDDGESLSNLEVLHILVIVEIVGKLEQLINFSLLLVLLLLLCGRPCRLLALLRLG